MRVLLVVLVGLCLEAQAYVPQIAPIASISTRRSSRSACRAPPLRVAMQFQSTSSARGREEDFKMPKSKPLAAKREPEGPLEDDPTLPMVEDIIRALDDRKVCSTNCELGWYCRMDCKASHDHLSRVRIVWAVCGGIDKCFQKLVCAFPEQSMTSPTFE